MNADMDENTRLNEELDKVLLQKVCEIYLDDATEYEQLLKETLAAGPHQFSSKHEDQMKKVLASANKKKRVDTFHKGVRRVTIAAAVAVLFFGAGGTYLVSNASWEDLRNFFLRRENTHTEIILPEDMAEEYKTIFEDTGWESAYYPTYLPKGCTLINLQATQDSCLMEFEHRDGMIRIYQSPLKLGLFLQIDTENAKITSFDVNGYFGEYVEKGSSRTVHFNTENYFIAIKSDNISETQLYKVAKYLQMFEITK